MPGGLQAVFFDIDDTLFPTYQFAWDGRQKAVEAMIKAGLRADAQEMLERLKRIIEEYSSNYPGHYDVLMSQYPAEAYAPANPAVIVASGIVAYHTHKARNLFPYEDAKELLTWLRHRGIPAGIITSGIPVKQAEKLVRMNLLEFFKPDWIYVSQQLGLSKQDAGLYFQVCKLAGVEPRWSMYVGDHPVNDVDMASQAGMITVLSKRSGHYSKVAGTRKPDYEIANFLELIEIIGRDFPQR